MESLDFDNGDARDLTIRIMPEQMERLQHFADKARVSLARFMREGAELLAAEMADRPVDVKSQDEAVTGALH